MVDTPPGSPLVRGYPGCAMGSPGQIASCGSWPACSSSSPRLEPWSPSRRAESRQEGCVSPDAQPPRRTTTTATSTTPAKRRVNNFTVPSTATRRPAPATSLAIRSLHPPFKLAWRFGGNALLEFPATIWGNNLYLLDDGATVKRVNITTGKQIWKRHRARARAAAVGVDARRSTSSTRSCSSRSCRLTCGTIGCSRRRAGGALDAQRQDPLDGSRCRAAPSPRRWSSATRSTSATRAAPCTR